MRRPQHAADVDPQHGQPPSAASGHAAQATAWRRMSRRECAHRGSSSSARWQMPWRVVSRLVGVPELRDDVLQRALQVRRDQHLGRFGSWRDLSFMIATPSARRCRGFEVDVGADRDRALLALKATCVAGEVMTVASSCCDLICVGVGRLREHEHVARDQVRRLRTEAREAAELLAGRLVRRRTRPWPSRP
jgi:hypothetical protein